MYHHAGVLSAQAAAASAVVMKCIAGTDGFVKVSTFAVLCPDITYTSSAAKCLLAAGKVGADVIPSVGSYVWDEPSVCVADYKNKEKAKQLPRATLKDTSGLPMVWYLRISCGE